MADESIFTSQTPANGDEVQPGGIVTAVTFIPAVDGVVKGVRFYATTTVGGTYTGELYEPTSDDDPLGTGTGTQLATEVAAVAPTPATWNVILFDTPEPVSAGDVLRATLHNTQGRYVVTGSFSPFLNGNGGVTNGNLWAPHNGDDLGFGGPTYQGTFAESATPVYPSNAFSSGNYFVDVVFEADTLPAEGQAALTLDLALASTGGTDAAGEAALGLELALATTGDAPPIDPGEGAAALSLALTLSGTGETPAVEPGEGAAALGLVLTMAATGDAPSVDPGEGEADFPLGFSFSGVGLTPSDDPGEGSAAFTLNLALASAGVRDSAGSAALGLALTLAATGDGDDFRCRPVRSFSEVMSS